MDEAYRRLPKIQQQNINKEMFVFAYDCIVQSKGDDSELQRLILRKTESSPHIRSDVIRYCRLVKSAM